ncbi:Hsp20/alpha crystallin family protein [Ammoniphilus sp. YIM 78166]|uniref:Hsp20/alpha crystallin family protein n=1 Tax=Ammoniphilus sp. YIM 78166 TaxID=1644106 RepID=UPI00106FB1D0|nr:Hsp20/alpha crystallin family protein [Ammoniphilus sp. YIM 78166]
MSQNDLEAWKKMAEQLLGKNFFLDLAEDLKQDGPLYNLYTDNQKYTILLDLPHKGGPPHLRVSCKPKEVIIEGTIPIIMEGMQPLVSQLVSGTFSKVIPLPEPIIASEMKYEYRNGMLQIELPRWLDQDS